MSKLYIPDIVSNIHWNYVSENAYVVNIPKIQERLVLFG